MWKLIKERMENKVVNFVGLNKVVLGSGIGAGVGFVSSGLGVVGSGLSRARMFMERTITGQGSFRLG